MMRAEIKHRARQARWPELDGCGPCSRVPIMAGCRLRAGAFLRGTPEGHWRIWVCAVGESTTLLVPWH